ncbi:MAG: tetratricopeptide repeat protein [Lentisphaeria bacterium]|nr:tetratricopeptide repeat protein [Lentisphaeria bacterium]
MKHLFLCLTASVVCGSLLAADTVDFSAWREGRAAAAHPDIQQAESLAAAGKHKKAARAFAKIEKKTADEAVAAYAGLARADAYYQVRDHFKAMDAYKSAVSRYPQSGDYTHGLNMLRLIAEDFAQARTKGFFKGFHKEDARELYRHIIGLAPFGEETGKDMLRLAALEREAHEINEAINTYQLILKRFAGTPRAETARLELAETFLTEARNTRDTIRLAEAAELHAERALREDPDQPEALAIKQAVKKIYAEYYHYLGEFYAGKAHYDAETAARYFTKVKTDFPESAEAADATLQLAMLSGEDIPEAAITPADTRKVPDPEVAVPGLKIDENAAPDDVVPETIIDDSQPKKHLLPIDDYGL